ncbi:MAG: tetratricopeptide repeat protein [Oscillatoriales cyanobacterium C42_A2020_001]|nr:tetratricopeptide repeat protein [Leptolyngbyaceae cyanobacterium C42_A2020_001]
MSDPVFTLLQQEQSQDAAPFAPSAPAISWGIILLFVGVLIGRRIRQQPPASEKGHSPHQLTFTQALQWVSYGKELERKEQYEAAIAVYDRGLNQHPNDFRLWHERGLALAKLQRFEQALESFNHAYALRPNDRDLAHERGDTLLQLEQFEQAIASFDRYLKYDPDSAHILADRGYALYRLDRYEEALRSLNQVLKVERRDRYSLIRAHYYQIESLRQLGQLEAALHSSQNAIAQHSDEHFVAQHQAIQQQISQAITNQEQLD